MAVPSCGIKGCRSCGWKRVPLDKRGGRNAYMCRFHAEQLESYIYENANHYGKAKMNGFTFGCELETSSSTDKARIELIFAGFVPTRDTTVDVEYKSSIYEGLNALSKQCVSIENLIFNGELEIGVKCGTHLHVGHREHLTPMTMGYIREYYYKLFSDLSRAMEENEAATKAIFGRTFKDSDYWAEPIHNQKQSTEMACNRNNFINVEHDQTLEFRLSKFQTAEQYMRCVKFAKFVVRTVINNFILHYNEKMYDTMRYPSHRHYLNHKAMITSKKIVRQFNKLAAELEY